MTISILQIGAENWAPYITDKLDWHHTSVLDLPTFLAMQRDPYLLEQTYVLLTDDHLESTLLSSQINEWPALRVIYFAHEVSSDFQKILDERRAFRIEENTPENIEKRIVNDMDTSQYGFSMRFSAEQFIPYVPEGIHLQRQGDFSTQFEGEFGEDWQQLGTLKAGTSDFQSGRANEVWLEYHHSEEAEPALLFVFYKNGEVLAQQLIAGQSLRQLTTVAPPEDYENYEILVLGKGQGTLDFYVIHQRASRHGLGHLLPGGTWQLTKENEEVLSYFNPGDCQKPLIVSFADTRLHVDGFEMQEALNRLGTPYLLFTDARIQGGAFDIGTAEYEATIIKIIKQKMKTLGLRSADLILMGASMGSYPALYYAADLNPAAVIIAKPIVNLGTFTAGSTISRGFDYGWRLDVRRYLSGYVRPDDNVAMNEKLWKHIENTNWTNIKVALFSMSQDEYDGQSLGQLLDFFATHNVPVKHESEEGQHTEKLDEMVDFMMTNLNVLRNTMRAEGE